MREDTFGNFTIFFSEIHEEHNVVWAFVCVWIMIEEWKID